MPPWASTADKAMKPKILASQIVTRIDPGHAFLINRNKGGSMVLAGETLFVLETRARGLCHPRRQRGGEGGHHQDRRLPDDRRHRPALPLRHRIRSARRGIRRRTGAGALT